MYMTGLADRPPVKQGLHQAEHLAGVNAAAAALAAVRLARHEGIGQRIDVSLQEAIALTGFPALNVYTHTGAVVKRAPSTLAQLMTSQAMRASNGWVMPSDAGIDVWWEAFRRIPRPAGATRGPVRQLRGAPGEPRGSRSDHGRRVCATHEA